MNDNGRKFVSVTTTVMSTLIVVGIATVFTMSLASNAKQRDHETSRESHDIDEFKAAVSSIAQSVAEIEKQQIRQTVAMEAMREDINEIREGQP